MPTRYGYLLKIQCQGSQALKRLAVDTTFQFAPSNVFRLHSGENTIHCHGDRGVWSVSGSAGQARAESDRLRVTLRYRGVASDRAGGEPSVENAPGGARGQYP